MIFPICNKRPERAPVVFGHTFFLCWRCTMATLGIILALIFMIDLYSLLTKKFYIESTLLCLPMIVDGFLQYFFGINSTNLRRAITGFLFGIGAALQIAYITAIL